MSLIISEDNLKSGINEGVVKALNNKQVNMYEARLQSICFTWHWNSFPSERGRLFMVYNNPNNRIEGAVLKGMGMVPGVSDLIYLFKDEWKISPSVKFLECKLPGCKQDKEQIKFESMVKMLGFGYYLFHSLDEFKLLIL